MIQALDFTTILQHQHLRMHPLESSPLSLLHLTINAQQALTQLKLQLHTLLIIAMQLRFLLDTLMTALQEITFLLQFQPAQSLQEQLQLLQPPLQLTTMTATLKPILILKPMQFQHIIQLPLPLTLLVILKTFQVDILMILTLVFMTTQQQLLQLTAQLELQQL